MSTRRLALIGAALTGVAACGDPPPGDTYFDHFIQPVLVQNCANNVSGCHRTNEGDPFDRAAGNLDVTTFERISKRRDLLATFGTYKYPPLLIKATAPTLINTIADSELTVNYNGLSLFLEVAHSGQGVLDVDSEAYLLLADWLNNGATENGLKPPTPPQTGEGACSGSIPPNFDAAAAMAEPGFSGFRDKVQPVFEQHNCAAGNCHGAPQADFYITCGNNDTEVAFNYTQTHAFVGSPVEQSQILNVPLAREAGGLGHTGGDQFSSRNAQDYLDVRDWAEAAGPMVFAQANTPEEFFAKHVQPIFLQRGCSFMNCHSPAATNDFKLRSGSQGFFSPLALQKNYDLLKYEFMSLEYPDARTSRVVSKNILPGAGGIRHRGGPVLETPTRNVENTVCPPFNPAAANIETEFLSTIPAMPAGQTQFSPFCTIQAWVSLERNRLGVAVLPFAPNGTADVVYVDRPGGASGDTLTEFNNYRPGSELRIATFNLDANRHLSTVATDVGATGCAGATFGAGGNADVRAPDVSMDGDTVAFAMRIGAGEGLQIWTYRISTGACTRVTTPASGNSITIDNFDPVWSPDGQWIVFASSRGGPEGPTHARSPGFQPQSDIWRMHADGSMPEQVTFLSNSEIGPAFMREGRITMTTEKVYLDTDANQGAGVFHQLSGRRINWDRTDYHPLLVQRARSPYADPNDPSVTLPTVDFSQATDIRERANGDFLMIVSDVGANGGGGALAIFNRSAGTFEVNRIGIDPAFLESVTFINPGDANMGRLNATTAYRGAFGLPDGEILTSYATLGGTLDNANNINWKLTSVTVNTSNGTGTNRQLITRAGAQMEGVLVVKKPPGAFFTNRRQLVFGGQTDLGHAGDAFVHFPDAPMVFTLFTGNLRRGHPVDRFRAATAIEFFTEGRNISGTETGDGIYQVRNRIGKVDLAEDDSARVKLPSGQGVVMRLINSDGVVVSMGEEHQFGPGEEISLGIQESLFDAACGGCHGSVSQSELDIATRPDVLTGASASISQNLTPVTPQ